MAEQRSGITRRRFVRDAGVAGLVAADALAGPAFASAQRRGEKRRPTVAVFGGGIAGLTAAHELAERGFDVTVYERRAWGGKARSTEVPNSASGGRGPLPGEHGVRTFFGFFQNTIDTFRRIPIAGNHHGVFDYLVPLPKLVFARDGGRRDLALLIGDRDPRAYTPGEVIDLAVGLLLQTDLPPDAVAHFGQRVATFLSSCEARRIGQWENVTWNEFAGGDRFSEDYRRIVVKTFCELFQASNAEQTSAAFPGRVLEWVIYNILGIHANGPVLRILDRPTNEALFDPWLARLRALGVHLREGREVTRLGMHRGRITSAEVRSRGHTRRIRADWYVCALPVDWARRLWRAPILAADPQLARMRNLDTAWLSGMKFFLRERTPIFEGGAVVCVDAPWTIGGLTQAQYWSADFASTYGDGHVKDCLSIDISNWTRPGVLFGKPARECTPAEIAAEAWEQLKRHLNDTGTTQLTDDLLHSWNIDPGIRVRRGRLTSEDPLVLPAAGQRSDRPDVRTAITNLFLAGDYLKSSWDVANMETASYNARRAVNAILRTTGSRETPAAVIEPYRPPEWEPLKRIDEDRWRRGQPNLFDAELGKDEVRRLLARYAP